MQVENPEEGFLLELLIFNQKVTLAKPSKHSLAADKFKMNTLPIISDVSYSKMCCLSPH